MREPPPMAKINPAEAILASSPNPFSAMAYIVGNIKDMHAEIATNEYKPIIPGKNIAPKVNIPPPKA